MSRKKPDIFRIQKALEEGGFRWEKEFMEALELVDPRTKLEALISMAPYLMAKMPQIKEETAPEPIDVTDVQKQLASASNEDLIRLLTSGQETNKKNN